LPGGTLNAGKAVNAIQGKGARVMMKATSPPPRLQLDWRLRAWLDSPQERALRERLQRVPKLGFPLEPDDEPPESEAPSTQSEPLAKSKPLAKPPPAPSSEPSESDAPSTQSEPLAKSEPVAKPEPPSEPSPKKAVGRPRILTDDEVLRLQAAYQAIRNDKPILKQASVFEKLCALLDKHVPNSTLRRWVVRPVAPK
jgi:hypothetical protein